MLGELDVVSLPSTMLVGLVLDPRVARNKHMALDEVTDVARVAPERA